MKVSKDLSNEISHLISKEPFGLRKDEKLDSLLNICKLQIEYHFENCKPYRNWFKKNSFLDQSKIENMNELPFLPSSVFKHVNLMSSENKSKIISSSGTTSQLKSNIYLDSKTSLNQTSALSKILSFFLGKKRKHFFIIDYEPKGVKKDLGEMTARFAGMSGYLMAAKKRHYLLKEGKNNSPEICKESLKMLNDLSKESSVVIIGYTFMIWQFLNNKDFQELDFKVHAESKIIHFGGWKKLASEKVSKEELNQVLESRFCIDKKAIYDVYGFTEQLGTIYVSSGDDGCFVTDYSHVIVRDIKTLEEVPDGQKGFLQFISCLPESYPGFSILNDDIGYISKREIDSDGKEILQFKVVERLKQAEARGCGDTLPENYFI
tara:strand:- start:17384 stop:18514 length:1131 start_codon:yes stop_codon:yes gene_type:complete